MNVLRVGWLYLKMGVLNELQYRVNFFVQLFQALIQVAVALVVLALVYSHTTTLNGWTQPELLTLMGVQILLGGIIHTFVQPNMGRLMDDVQKGTLDQALTKPEDAQLLVSVREVRIWSLVEVVSGSIVLIVGSSRLQSTLGGLDTLAFLAALSLGAVMLYCFWLVITTGAFWIVRMDHVLELFEGIYATGRFPVGIYPSWMRYGVTFLVPVGFAVTVPAQALTARLHGLTLLGAAGFALALFIFTRWFWRFGLKRYSGASA